MTGSGHRLSFVCDGAPVEIAVDPGQIRHQYAGASFGVPEILRCAKQFKLKARSIATDWARLAQTPLPALAECRDGSFIILGKIVDDKIIIQDPQVGRRQSRHTATAIAS